MKKLLSLLLAFVMISSTVSFSSFVSLAEDVEEAITEETVVTEEAFASEEIITDESDNIEESDLNEASDIVEEEAIALEEESASSEAPDKESGTVVGDIVTASGKCGDNLTWELDTLGVLTISGTGDMEDFPYDSRLYSYITPWESYWNSIKSVVISEGVTSVSNHAFYDYYTNLTKVTIADTVTYIGSGAFARNDSLTTVVLSGGVTSMGSSVFANNGALSSVTIGEGITVLGDKVFYECPALKSLTFPDSLKTIGDEAFVRSGLTNVKFGSGLTYIGYQAFIASDVTRVDIPSLEAWCNISFDDVFSNPFYYTKKLYVDGQIVKDLVIPDGVTVIKPYAFSYYTTLTSITIPSSVKKISYNAFRSCINVQKLNIAHGVEMIDVYAFYHCTGLTSITVPDSVTYIANSAFYSCKNLESITLPFIGNKLGSETDTERYTFGYIFGTSSFTGSVEIYQYHENGSCRYYVPASLKNVTITGGDISYGAFSNCSMLESITYPDSITDIPPYTFYGCTSLKQINVPNSVTNIGEYAFYQCQNLTSIDVPDSITSIEDYTFAGCAVLSKVEIPNKVTSIGDYAFSECLKLTELNIPVGVTYIGENAFRQCTKFANISLPYGVSYIGSYAFNNTGYYNNSANWTGDVLYIGNHLVATQTTLSGHYDIVPLTRCIAGSAFRECELLTSVSIPNSVVYIGTNAFYLSGVYNNTDNWENGVLYIGDCLIAADSCVSGEYVVIDGTRLIKDKAFSNRSELNYITIPKTVKYIGTDAFIGCTNLTVRCSEGSAAEKYALANSIPVSYLHTECVFTSYISNNNGNCYEDGTMTALCDLGCGKTDTVTEPDSKIHDYYLDIARAATCQRDGLGVNICNICRDYYTEIIPKVGHKYSSYIYNEDATCYADGTKTAVCTYGCGAEDTILAEGTAAHRYTNYVYNEDATCTKNGTKTAYCDFGCGNSKTLTASYTKLPHDYTRSVIEESTCISNGIMICICKGCKSYTYEDLPFSEEHSGEWTITIEPTVNSEGEKTRICSLCGVNETEAVAKIEIPVLDTDNYVVSITSAEYIKYIRYAYGQYSTSAEIKNAADCVTLNHRNVMAYASEGVAKLTMEKGGYYSFWIKLADGSEYVYIADLSVMEQSVAVDASTVTVSDLYGVKDFFIAYGEHNSYRDVKDNLLVQITSKKIGDSHDYSYSVNKSGIYTLCVRYDDITREYKFITFEVVLPEVVFTETDSGLNISGINDIKVIRYAYGEYNSTGAVKRAEGAVAYSGKGRLKGVDEYTLSFTKEGPVTVSLVFNNGYSVIYKYKA